MLLLAGPAAALAAEAELSAEVPAEKWRALRLKNLPQGARLTVRIETTGPIRVTLVREGEVQRFPGGLKPTFSGRVDRRLSFRVAIPVAGTYYVILDNRKGNAARDVRIYVEAHGARKPRPKRRPQQPGMDAT